MMYAGGTCIVCLALILHGKSAHVCPRSKCGIKGDIKEPGSSKYWWPRARGHVGSYSVTNFSGPVDLHASMAWSWQHHEGQYHTTVLGGPVFDDEASIYLAAEDGIRKFSSIGDVIWHYQPPHGFLSTAVSIMDGNVFGNSRSGWFYSVNMETGRPNWEKKLAHAVCADTAYVEAYEGLVIAGAETTPSGGSISILAINATSGDVIWAYNSSKIFWNFMAVFPDSTSFITQDIHGGVYRFDLHTGKQIWHTPPPQAFQQSWTDGNVILGPDGTAYTCSDHHSGESWDTGAIRAYHLEDGRLLWRVKLARPCTSWAAVTDSLLVIPVAPLPGNIGVMKVLESWWASNKILRYLFRLSLALGKYQQWLWWNPSLYMEVWALDPHTGRVKWIFKDIEPWRQPACRGDDERFFPQITRGVRAACATAGWGSPTIDAEGVAWIQAMDGFLYGIKDANGDGFIDANSEVRKFEVGSASLHPGVSFAPGMMAAATCDTLYVWKY